MPAREAYAVAVLGALIFLVAFNLQAGWVYAVDALVGGLLVAGFVSAHLSVRGVSAGRVMPAEVVEGEPVHVTLSLMAHGYGWRFFLEALDAVPGLEPAAAFVATLSSPNRSVPAAYTATAVRRGIHRVERLELRSGGLTGLVVARRALPAPGEITVYPRYWKISGFPLAGWTTAPETSGSTPKRGGLEFYGLRDYRSGDSVRYVHWRSSARRGSLMVREFEQDLPASATLLLDTRAEVQAGDESTGTFEDLVRAAASIAWFVTARGGTVRLLAARGPAHLEVTGGWREVLRALAEIRPKGMLSPGELLSRTGRGSSGSVIVLTPDADAVTGLAGSGVNPVAVLADAASYDRAGSERRHEDAPDHGPSGVPVCLLRKGDDIGARLEGSTG